MLGKYQVYIVHDSSDKQKKIESLKSKNKSLDFSNCFLNFLISSIKKNQK